MKILINWVLATLLFLVCTQTYAQRKTYEYDDLNRLSTARYWEGSVEKYTVTYTYDEVGNRLTKVISGGTCQAPTATLSGSQTINAGQTANLTVAFTGGAPYSFVFNGVPYSGINSGSYSVPVSPTATTTYTLTSVSNVCGAGTVSGSATVMVGTTCTAPQPPTVSPATIISGQTATLTATNCGGTVNWYSMSSGGSSLATGSSFTTPALTATTTYYASCTVNNCVSNTRGSGTVTVNPPTGCDPFEPNNTLTMATVVSGDNYTSPDLCLDVTSDEDWFKWTYGGVSYYFQVRLYSSDSQTGKYKLLLTVENGLLTVRTATVDGTSTDTYLYMYSADNTLLTSNDDDPLTSGLFSRITYTLPNNCTPPQPPSVSSATINFGETATLTARGCSGTVNWYGTANGGASLNTGTSFTTPALTATTTYYANCTVNNCVSTTRGSGTVTINSTTSGEIFSIKTGSWHDPSTWDCNCVPNNTHTVEIKASHTVTVSTADAHLKNLKLSSGNLNFLNQKKLCFGCN